MQRRVGRAGLLAMSAEGPLALDGRSPRQADFIDRGLARFERRAGTRRVPGTRRSVAQGRAHAPGRRLLGNAAVLAASRVLCVGAVELTLRAPRAPPRRRIRQWCGHEVHHARRRHLLLGPGPRHPLRDPELHHGVEYEDTLGANLQELAGLSAMNLGRQRDSAFQEAYLLTEALAALRERHQRRERLSLVARHGGVHRDTRLRDPMSGTASGGRGPDRARRFPPTSSAARPSSGGVPCLQGVPVGPPAIGPGVGGSRDVVRSSRRRAIARVTLDPTCDPVQVRHLQSHGGTISRSAARPEDA